MAEQLQQSATLTLDAGESDTQSTEATGYSIFADEFLDGENGQSPFGQSVFDTGSFSSGSFFQSGSSSGVSSFSGGVFSGITDSSTPSGTTSSDKRAERFDASPL